MKTTKIVAYPCYNVFYYSFYIKGLIDLFGIDNISHSTYNIPVFTNKCFAFTVNHNSATKNIIIDATDGMDIREKELDWCDIYGKVNLSKDYVNANNTNKIIPIGPSFGVKIYNPTIYIIKSIANYFRANGRILDIKEHFANYRRQYKYRFKEEEYFPCESSDNYIFFTSTLWKGDDDTNEFRRRFIVACKQIEDVKFEGGFSPFLPGHEVQGYEKYQMSKRYDIHEYVTKIKKSAIVFNTPAVYKCHGWKLGEYLAMGKAIISTPLTREMPEELIHGKHIHYTDGSIESLMESIRYLINNKQYRKHLENNARAYYEKHLAPDRVVLKLIN